MLHLDPIRRNGSDRKIVRVEGDNDVSPPDDCRGENVDPWGLGSVNPLIKSEWPVTRACGMAMSICMRLRWMIFGGKSGRSLVTWRTHSS
jgi:hypothetical protein